MQKYANNSFKHGCTYPLIIIPREAFTKIYTYSHKNVYIHYKHTYLEPTKQLKTEEIVKDERFMFSKPVVNFSLLKVAVPMSFTIRYV